MLITLDVLVKIFNGKVLQTYDNEFLIKFLLTDSRKITAASQSIFFAIKGERHNGHKFLNEVYQAGVKLFVVEEAEFHLYKTGINNVTIITVFNAIYALQALAAYKRKFYEYPVIGITGSNAKTIIKEWLSQLLSPRYAVVKNPRSYNSQIGVPLSVWQMSELHNLGIFEAGVSKPGEMQRLETIIKPSIGVFTNIGSAHDEGFESREQKIVEKLKLFQSVETLIYCKDHELIHHQIEKYILKSKTISWAYKHSADYQVNIHSIEQGSVSIEVMDIQKQLHDFVLPFNDSASIENITHCIVLLLFLNENPAIIQKKLHSLKPVSMRLELKEGINNCYIIDDSYNNDLAGLNIALDFLKQQNQKTNKTLILSDLLESGMEMKTLYSLIAESIKDKGVTRLITVGEELGGFKENFITPTYSFDTTEELLGNIKSLKFRDEIVLIKGARSFEFEKVVKVLQQQSHRTVFEINLDALSANLNYYRSKLERSTKIMVMVKSFAYGAGSLEVANLLQFHRVDYLAVAYADEGVYLRESGITLPIMVMNASIEDFESLLNYKLEPVVYSESFLQKLASFLNTKNVKMLIHLEIETGMNRLGINESEVASVVQEMKKADCLIVASVFSHLAGADEEQFSDYTHIQFGILLRVSAFIENQLRYKFIKHILNSAGIVRYPDFQLDMVRLGIGLYGVEANGLEQQSLIPVGTLKTTISQIKTVKSGDSVGYSRKGKAQQDITIGTIAIGYGDGYSRAFSNGIGKVWINGHLAPVIGNVCMDMTMINLTGINASEGDEVIIFGKEQSIIDLAKSINTIPYELLTGVSERVKRVFYSE
jgi:alanine racemase